jgi:hypothetical protein
VPYPNFLCVGAQKAGTSWLYLALLQHPDVWMPPVKELHFFNTLYDEADVKWTQNAIRRLAKETLQAYLKKTPLYLIDYAFLEYTASIASGELFTEEWYQKVFSWHGAKHKLRGEFTPAYLSLPAEGISYVGRLIEDVKIIVIVRDPLERILSHIRMIVAGLKKHKLETGIWNQALADPAVKLRGDYKQFLPLWQQGLPADRILFVPYGDIATDPKGLIARIEAFLGLRPFSDYENLGVVVHKTPLIIIPPAIVENQRRNAVVQREFISDFLGADFAKRMASPKREPISTAA